MDNTYVVYSEEYYFSGVKFRTIMRKKVYTVTYDETEAQEVCDLMNSTLQQQLDAGEVNDNYEILTTFSVKTIPLEGHLSIDEAKSMVVDDDYTWGKVGKAK